MISTCRGILFQRSWQPMRSFARKKRHFPTFDDLLNYHAESIEEIYEKKFGSSEILEAPNRRMALAQRAGSRRVLIYPEANKELRQLSEPVTEFDADLRQLTVDMLEAMYAQDGVGISAPQLGVLKRVIAINENSHYDKSTERIFINPKILKVSKKCQVLDEGCLSFPDTMVSVSRRARIDIEYLDLDGKEHAERVIGFEARIIQHEIDHLDGVLLIDKANDNPSMLFS